MLSNVVTREVFFGLSANVDFFDDFFLKKLLKVFFIFFCSQVVDLVFVRRS